MSVARSCPLTPSETVVALIDFQPQMFCRLAAPMRTAALDNAVAIATVAEFLGIPVILTALSWNGFEGDVLPEIREIFPEETVIRRSRVNAWEDLTFRSAVTNFGRKKIVLASLWTEAGVYLPAVAAVAEGYDIYIPVDACGDITAEVNDLAIRRTIEAGVFAITASEMMFEWQRDALTCTGAGQ